MLELPDWKQLRHIVELDVFVTHILIPFCVQARWHVDYEFLEDRCYVIGHYNQDKPEDWQRFIEEFLTPFCQERGWQVENLPEEDAAILIHAPTPVEDPEPKTDVQQLGFFDLCPADREQSSNYEYERRL